ncbi:MAG: hypothetical protein GXP31_05055 [Kiritimatiellaeota bacterium]|nr:hypothetical protein [Kiritimatiellota bacterium]
MMHRSVLYSALVIGMGFAVGAAAQVQRFDFGTSDSDLAPGWTRITETELFSDGAGRGWLVKPVGVRRPFKLYSRDENFATQTAFLKLGPILRDHVIAGRNYSGYPKGDYTFRVRVGEGEFLGAVVMGVMTEKHATLINRPPFWWRDCTVRVNGQTAAVFEHGGIREQLVQRGKISERDFLPGDSLFDRGVRSHFRTVVFRFRGPELNLSMPTFCPLNALLVAPAAEEARLKKALADALASEKFFVDSQYTETKDAEPFPEPVRKAAEAAGAVLFARPQRVIGPYARPTLGEVGRPCGEFVPVGEKGVLRFGFLPVRDLHDVRVSVGALRHASGKTVPAREVSVWLSQLVPMAAVRTGDYYRIVPEYAFRYAPRTLRKGVARFFSVYVNVPNDAVSGDYAGEAVVSSPDLPRPLRQRLVVKVLPFRLDPPDMLFGMYWGNPFSTRLRHAWQQMRVPAEQMRELCSSIDIGAFREMREAGFNTAAFGPAAPVSGVTADGRIEVDGHLWQLWCDRVRNYETVFGRAPLPAYNIGWSGLITSRATGGFWGREVDQWEKHGFSAKSVRNMEAICTWFYAQARERNWPEIVFYIQDEMANHGTRGGRMALARAKLFRKVADRVGFRTCASMNGPVEIPTIPYLDIAIPNGALPISEENIAYIRRSGAELWFYNIGSNRFSFGYYLAKTRPKGRLQWSFGGSSRYVNQVAGLPSVSDVRYTLHWDSKLRPGRRNNIEEMRQGILDYRYFRTLDRLIAENSRSSAPSVRRAVEKAKKLRDYILDGVKVRNRHSGEDFVAGVWSSRTCQRLRWRIALAVMDLLDPDSKGDTK